MSKFKYFQGLYDGNDLDEEINTWIKSQPYSINIIKWEMRTSDRGRVFILIEYQ